MAHELVVLGAGYAGLAAARRAAHDVRRSTADVHVTLVNATPDFVERVRLHQVASGQDVGVHPLSESLDGSGVDLEVGWVEGIDTEVKSVDVRTGDKVRQIAYDTLVHALGSTAGRDVVPGSDKYTVTVTGLDGARAVAERIASERPGRLAVVGGGLTGLEVASELAERHPGIRVDLVSRGEVATGVSRLGRAHVRRVMDRLGVALREHASVAEVDAEGLKLEDGTRVPADIVVWNAGFTVSPLAREAGLAVDGHGRALVHPDQRSTSHPDVYVVGDAAHAPGVAGEALRMSCAMGMPMGWSAADVILARLSGREPDTRPFGYLFQCVSLGRKDGLIQFVHADDSPRGLILTGRPSVLYKEYIVASAYSGLRGSAGQAGMYMSLMRGAARRFTRRGLAQPGDAGPDAVPRTSKDA